MATLTRTALQVNAAVGILSTVAAAVAQHEYGAIVTAVVSQLAGWLHAVLRFL
jgi:hypothetical protein